jgi:hypothetical protein
MGIVYCRYHLTWDPKGLRFLVQNADEDQVGFDYRDWQPPGVIWPYSFDQRVLPLPKGAPVCNPLPYYLGTTNKLLAAELLHADRLVPAPAFPPTASLGLLSAEANLEELYADLLGAAPLCVIKPAAGRRSYGVLLLPRAALSDIVGDIGAAASRDDVELGAKVLAISFLWCSGVDLLSLIQPYVQPQLGRSPRTNQYHTSLVRAVVLAEDGASPRCIDAVRVLCRDPRDGDAGRLTREAFILGACTGGSLELPDDEREPIERAAEAAIAMFERGVPSHLEKPDEMAAFRLEAAITMRAVDRCSDVAVMPFWKELQTEITVREILSHYVS